MIPAIVFAVIFVALTVFFVIGYNKLVKLKVVVDEAESGIDVALKRRADLIPNLVETVKGYAAHEAGTFDAVTRARAATMGASTLQEKVAADKATSGALANLMAVAENYPALQAVASFTSLQEELTSTENRVAFSRQNYNANVTLLNTAVSTIPWMFFAGIAKVTKRDFWEVEDAADRAVPTIQF